MVRARARRGACQLVEPADLRRVLPPRRAGIRVSRVTGLEAPCRADPHRAPRCRARVPCRFIPKETRQGPTRPAVVTRAPGRLAARRSCGRPAGARIADPRRAGLRGRGVDAEGRGAGSGTSCSSSAIWAIILLHSESGSAAGPRQQQRVWPLRARRRTDDAGVGVEDGLRHLRAGVHQRVVVLLFK